MLALPVERAFPAVHPMAMAAVTTWIRIDMPI